MIEWSQNWNDSMTQNLDRSALTWARAHSLLESINPSCKVWAAVMWSQTATLHGLEFYWEVCLCGSFFWEKKMFLLLQSLFKYNCWCCTDGPVQCENRLTLSLKWQSECFEVYRIFWDIFILKLQALTQMWCSMPKKNTCSF